MVLLVGVDFFPKGRPRVVPYVVVAVGYLVETVIMEMMLNFKDGCQKRDLLGMNVQNDVEWKYFALRIAVSFGFGQ